MVAYVCGWGRGGEAGAGGGGTSVNVYGGGVRALHMRAHTKAGGPAAGSAVAYVQAAASRRAQAMACRRPRSRSADSACGGMQGRAVRALVWPGGTMRSTTGCSRSNIAGRAAWQHTMDRIRSVGEWHACPPGIAATCVKPFWYLLSGGGQKPCGSRWKKAQMEEGAIFNLFCAFLQLANLAFPRRLLPQCPTRRTQELISSAHAAQQQEPSHGPPWRANGQWAHLNFNRPD